mgnify:CR=1 FL=1
MFKKDTYPSKTRINLAMREKRQIDPKIAIPAIFIVLLLVAAVAKFGVIDRMAQVAEAQRGLDFVLSQKAYMEAAVADYEEVRAEYAKYSINWMDDVERSLVKKTDMIDLLDNEILVDSETRSINISGNTISAELVGLDMEASSALVERLYERDDVAEVQVFRITTEETVGDQVIVSILITMKLPEGGE